uniref:Cytochrome c oxidase subunit 2 n=1 Tax=Tanacetum cinerariifolium TaxID=118510 RepID=A0A6L2KHC4_TANCI|nr:cytochrome c oxidase subunit 2 [Tanacetum cinerariifolium]
MSFLVGPTGEISLLELEEQEQVSPFFGGAKQSKNETDQMIVLKWLFLTIAHCDAAKPWKLGSQDAVTPMMHGYAVSSLMDTAYCSRMRAFANIHQGLSPQATSAATWHPDMTIDWRSTVVDRWSGGGPAVAHSGLPSLTTVDRHR